MLARHELDGSLVAGTPDAVLATVAALWSGLVTLDSPLPAQLTAAASRNSDHGGDGTVLVVLIRASFARPAWVARSKLSMGLWGQRIFQGVGAAFSFRNVKGKETSGSRRRAGGERQGAMLP